MPRLRSFWSYYGAKWQLVPRYPAPEHGLIVEPFAGSACYALAYPERDVVLAESDPVVAGLWRWLIGASPSDVLDLPDPEPGQDIAELDVPEPARHLIGFWCARGQIRPRRHAGGSWMTEHKARRPGSFWGRPAREMIARQVHAIRHWRVVDDYRECPDQEATWFVDPPYRGPGRHYRHGSARLDFGSLASWCRSRRGLRIVCEQRGADWLPFEDLQPTHKSEVAWVSRSGAPCTMM